MKSLLRRIALKDADAVSWATKAAERQGKGSVA